MIRFKLIMVRKYGEAETLSIYAGDFAELQAREAWNREYRRAANVYVALFEGRKLIKQHRRFK